MVLLNSALLTLPSNPHPPSSGDDVKPFYVDQPLLAAASRKPEDLEDPAGLETGAEAQQRRQPGRVGQGWLVGRRKGEI